jgi:hypothetical protein
MAAYPATKARPRLAPFPRLELQACRKTVQQATGISARILAGRAEFLG